MGRHPFRVSLFTGFLQKYGGKIVNIIVYFFNPVSPKDTLVDPAGIGNIL
jgi:hypothetical protein